MPNPPRRLPDIVQSMLAERGWSARSSTSEHAPATKDNSQLVFIGNWQDPCPRRLLFDPHLEPVDIVTWQVIRVHADASRVVAFPSYTDLMSAIRVSRATVARALGVLRLTRWLPLCAALRDAHGRFAGHVYALNDEPLPLSEILAIDEGYVGFTEQACSHRSAHVRALAQDTFEIIRKAAVAPESSALEPLRVGDHLGNRLDQLLHLLGDMPLRPVSAASMSLGKKACAARTAEETDRVQNLNAVHPVQNLNVVGSSSINIITTTTLRSEEPEEGAAPVAHPSSLVFPPALSLTDSQRRVLVLRLGQIPTNLRQDILDEAAGRVLLKRSTADPVRCEFDYVARLCVRALDGQFILTDVGERIRRNRNELGKTEARLRRAKAYSEAERLKMLETHEARAQPKTVPDE